MYSDEFLDDPGHLRIFVPDNKDLKSRLRVRIMTRPSGCIGDEIIPTMASLEISIGEGWGRQRNAGLQDV